MLEGINERIVALGRELTAEDLRRVFTHATNGEIQVAQSTNQSTGQSVTSAITSLVSDSNVSSAVSTVSSILGLLGK